MKLGELFGKKKAPSGPVINCRRSLQTESGLVLATFDCLHCGADGDLRSPVCYGNVVKAFVDDVQIDNVVLADLSHRQYSGDLLDVMRAQADLVRTAERSAMRAGAAAEEKSSKCAGCPVLPSRALGPVAEAARRTPAAAAEAASASLALFTKGVPTSHAHCPGCFAESAEAARHLADLATTSKSALGAIAYNVAEAGR